MALLEEANKINKWDMLVRHEMSGLSLNLTFYNKSRNHNKFESWSPLSPFPDHLISQTIPIVLLMVVTMLDVNISVTNAVTPPISSGTVLFTPAEPAIK
jgi:hypothetical protein